MNVYYDADNAVKLPFFIDEGELLFDDAGDGFRTGILNMALHSVFSIGDSINAMECHGFMVDEKALKSALQQMYDALMRETTFKFNIADEEAYKDKGKFDLIPRQPEKKALHG